MDPRPTCIRPHRSSLLDVGDLAAGDRTTGLAVAWLRLPAEHRSTFPAAAGSVLAIAAGTWNCGTWLALALVLPRVPQTTCAIARVDWLPRARYSAFRRGRCTMAGRGFAFRSQPFTRRLEVLMDDQFGLMWIVGGFVGIVLMIMVLFI